MAGCRRSEDPKPISGDTDTSQGRSRQRHENNEKDLDIM